MNKLTQKPDLMRLLTVNLLKQQLANKVAFNPGVVLIEPYSDVHNTNRPTSENAMTREAWEVIMSMV